MYSVYVLQSLKTKRFYTGQTTNIARRIEEHNKGKTRSTAKKGPYQLIHLEHYSTRAEAVKRERYLKTGKGREELKHLYQ